MKEALNLVNKIETQRVPWLPYGLVPGCQFRVLEASPHGNVVIVNFKMPPHTVTQKHDHHCTAMAYTLRGQWMYENRVFNEGDIAFEIPGEVHQPKTAEQGAELLTILFAGKGNEKFLQNFEDDGSTYILGMRFFRALERITPAQLAGIDVMALLDKP